MLKKLVLTIACCSLLAACGNQETKVVDVEKTVQAEEKVAEVAATKLTSQVVKPTTTSSVKEATGEAVPITWNDFFDNGDQTKASKKFQSLSGEKIVFEGYMGEIINMNKGWFLLIQKPGAECPFCSNDQTFWNKIMIVFVKNPEHLRYIQGKVRVTGTLDVNVKQDESGYTTMFRIYHATFESAK